METSTDISAGPSGEMSEEGPDGKAEKRRKFKPFEVMRKFFRSSKKRSKTKEEDVNVVSMKAKSTSELLSQGIKEEEDDGGFRSHKGLSQTRSISEDSIFNPDPKDPKKANIEQFTKGAKSVENINQNFKSELATKLKKRQSFHSDDDGLPKSPVSSFTTADVILGGLKGTPGKSASRESDKSLLSVGSSDNEEDPFQTNWKAAVASVVTRRSKVTETTEVTMDLDLSVVQPTVALRSDAAKHRISVAPRARKGAKQGKKTPQQKVSNASALPKLAEESPSKISTDEDVFQLELSSTGAKDDSLKAGEKNPETVEVKKIDEQDVKTVSKKTDNADVKSSLKKADGSSVKSSVKKADDSDVKGMVKKGDSSELKPGLKADTSDHKPVLKKVDTAEKTKEEKTVESSSPTPNVSKAGVFSGKEVLTKKLSAGKSDDTKTPSETKVENQQDSENAQTSELSQAFSRLKKTSLKKKDDMSHDSDKENYNEESKTQKEDTKSELPSNQTKDDNDTVKPTSVQEKILELSRGKPDSKTQESKSKPPEGSSVATLSSPVVKIPLRPTLSAPTDNTENSSNSDEKPNQNESSSPSIGIKSLEKSETKADEKVDSKRNSGVKEPLNTVKTDSSSSEGKGVSFGQAVASSAAGSRVSPAGTSSIQRLSSPKEDYKTKRQGRSKTLPEHPLSKEVIKESVKASRNDYDNVPDTFTSPRNNYDNVTFSRRKPHITENIPGSEEKTPLPEKSDDPPVKKDNAKSESPPPSNASPSRAISTMITPAAKRPEPKRLSLKGGLVEDSSEPVWVMMARRKQAEEETKDKENSETDKSKAVDTTKTVGATENRTPSFRNNAKTPSESASASKPHAKDTKLNVKVSPPQQVKSVSQQMSVENKTKSEQEEKSPTSVASSTVSTGRPPLKFGRNLPVTKPGVTTSKPTVGKSFVIEKPSQVTSKPSTSSVKPSAESWKPSVSKPDTSSAGAKTSSSAAGPKSFTIAKSTFGNTIPSTTNSANLKKSEPKLETKTEAKPSSVPAWRSNLQKNRKDAADMKVPEMKKIEIIDKSGPVSPQKTTVSKPTEKPVEETPPVILREKPKADKCSDAVTARSSKVLDMVKNYQKLQVS